MEKFLLILSVSLSLFRAISCEIPNCEFCSLRSTKVCVNCKTGFEKSSDGGCKISETRVIPIENCIKLAYDARCLECIQGYALVEGYCEPECNEACECASPNICIDNSRELIPCTLSNCLNCQDDWCMWCSLGYHIDGKGKCVKCPEGCFECISGLCKVCNSEYTIVSGNCKQNCIISNCITCDFPNYCSHCNKGYFASEGICKACSSGCLECGSSANCTVCNEGYSLVSTSQSCVKNYNCTDPYCIKCTNSTKCTHCISGYGVNEFLRCETCTMNCHDCSESNTCTQCDNGYYQQNKVCVVVFNNSKLYSILYIFLIASLL